MISVFRVEVDQVHNLPGVWLSVSHSGSQWSTLRINTAEQAKLIVAKLVEYFGTGVLPG